MSLKDYFLSAAANTLLMHKSRPGAIRSALARRQYRRAAAPTRERVTVAVVQMHMDLLDDGVQFAEKYYGLTRQAVEGGAALIVFPEYAWLPILGLLPVTRDLAQKGVTLENAAKGLGEGLTLESILHTMAPAVKRIFETTGSELATRFGVWLMPGSAITTDSAGRLFNTAYLFGPDGALIGTQPKLHRTSQERWMTTGNELGVFELPFARVAMPVCMDYTYWETARVATRRGADILLGFSAEPKANDFFMAMRGIAARIQESFAFGVQAHGVTKLFGLNFCGPSYIVAPLGMRRDFSTFLASTRTHDHEEVIFADLDLAHLHEFRAANPRDFNRALYRKYLPQAYEAYRARLAQARRGAGGRQMAA